MKFYEVIYSLKDLYNVAHEQQSLKKTLMQMAFFTMITPVCIFLFNAQIYIDIYIKYKSFVIGFLLLTPVFVMINFLIWLILSKKEYSLIGAALSTELWLVIESGSIIILGTSYTPWRYIVALVLIDILIMGLVCGYHRLVLRRKRQVDKMMYQGYYIYMFENEREHFKYDEFLALDNIFHFDIPPVLRDKMRESQTK